MNVSTVRIIHDGDVLPMVGGPFNGHTRQVEFLMPFLNGGITPAAWSCKINGVEYCYTLDKHAHCWQYQEPPCNVSN